MRQGHYLHSPHLDDHSIMAQELRKWCDIYCANPKRLKQFRIEKRLFGWDLDQIKRGVYPVLSIADPMRADVCSTFKPERFRAL